MDQGSKAKVKVAPLEINRLPGRISWRPQDDVHREYSAIEIMRNHDAEIYGRFDGAHFDTIDVRKRARLSEWREFCGLRPFDYQRAFGLNNGPWWSESKLKEYENKKEKNTMRIFECFLFDRKNRRIVARSDQVACNQSEAIQKAVVEWVSALSNYDAENYKAYAVSVVDIEMEDREE